MPLLDLENGLVLCISEYLESESDINAFSQSNCRLHDLLNVHLYRHNVQQLRSSGLLWAAEHGQAATAQRFLEEGADIPANGQWQRMPLTLAARNGHEAVVKLLLAKD